MPETDWKEVAIDCFTAVKLMAEHYKDLGDSNPGFMGKLCLQDYALWNEALMAQASVLKKYGYLTEVEN